MKTDHILALIKFEEVNRFEWIYLGSPRISQVFRLYVKEKKLDNVISFRTYTACRTADVIMIEPSSSPNDRQGDRCENNNTNMFEYFSALNHCNHSNGRGVKQHDCSHDCVQFEDSVNLTKCALFRRPILCGWKRLDRNYQAPCGLDLFSYQEIDEYLTETSSKLRIDSFDLSRDIDPTKSYNSNVVKINVSFSFSLKSLML